MCAASGQRLRSRAVPGQPVRRAYVEAPAAGAFVVVVCLLQSQDVCSAAGRSETAAVGPLRPGVCASASSAEDRRTSGPIDPWCSSTVFAASARALMVDMPRFDS